MVAPEASLVYRFYAERENAFVLCQSVEVGREVDARRRGEPRGHLIAHRAEHKAGARFDVLKRPSFDEDRRQRRKRRYENCG